MDADFDRVFRKISRTFEALPGLIFLRWRDSTEKFTVDWERQMVMRTRGPLVLGKAKSPNALVASRTGGLGRSFTSRVVGSKLNNLEGQMWSTAGKQAALQEFGTKGKGGLLDTIKPRSATFLTIPLPGALTASGVPKSGLLTAGDWIVQENAFFLDDGERLLLVKDEGPAGDIIPLFVLKREVDVPPRLGMRKVFNESIPGFVNTLEKDVDEALLAATRGKGGS